VSHKDKKITALIAAHQGQDLDPHYLGYFDCFNRQLYFEAHEVLETIWLKQRGGADDRFYKGLIQLAGAFVHLQKHRPGPAAALFRLSEANLRGYPAVHHRLNVQAVAGLIREWLNRLTRPAPASGSTADNGGEVPRLALQPAPAE
jgi:predicted metal-dependent hydrolase